MKAGLSTLQAMSTALRKANWRVSAAMRGNEIVSVYPSMDIRPVGLAVDIGTTKLACYLVDLGSGGVLAVQGVANPQIAYGEIS